MRLFGSGSSERPPFGLKWRSSKYYIALVTAIGLLTDVLLFPLYSAAIPPRLQALGYADVASLSGWLSASYAAGLIITTFPFTWLSARTRNKRVLLLAALVLMAAGILLFLLVPNYAAMVVARVLQGAAGSGVWVVGLALVADNVPEESLGRMMGCAMLGFAVGQAIGLPVGGVLYGQLGWKAPSIFALALVAVDFCLRLLVLERHEAHVWLSKAANLDTHSMEIRQGQLPTRVTVGPDLAVLESVGLPNSIKEEHKPNARETQLNYNSLKAIAYLLSNPKPITALLISFTNGFLVAGMYNTALVLRLYQRYQLDETHAGYVFFAVAIPAAVMSPISGWLCDRIGPRPLSILCCTAFVPSLCLLMIETLPLSAFAVLLVLCGICSGLINAPVMVFLAHIASHSDGRVASSHCYGGFNLAFALSAFLGPIIAGQILQAVGTPVGFKIQVGLTSGLLLLCVPLAYFYMRMPKDERIKSNSH